MSVSFLYFGQMYSMIYHDGQCEDVCAVLVVTCVSVFGHVLNSW